MMPSTSKSPKTATVSPVGGGAREAGDGLVDVGQREGVALVVAVEEGLRLRSGGDAAAFEEALHEGRVVGEAEVAGVGVASESPATLQSVSAWSHNPPWSDP